MSAPTRNRKPPVNRRPRTEKTRIEKQTDGYHVWVNNRHHGVAPDRRTAERMRDRQSPHVGVLAHAHDRVLWVAWNLAVNGGATVLQDVDGTQLVSFGTFWLTARPDDLLGWDCEHLSHEAFQELFVRDDDTLNLRLAGTPYILELTHGERRRLRDMI